MFEHDHELGTHIDIGDSATEARMKIFARASLDTRVANPAVKQHNAAINPLGGTPTSQMAAISSVG